MGEQIPNQEILKKPDIKCEICDTHDNSLNMS